jgi:hypothetical protein
MADYPLDSSGSRYYLDGSPVAPYTDPKNPNYSTLIANPGLVNTSFPIKQGSNTSQIQYNRQGSSVYQYYTQTNSTIAASGKYVPYNTFKSHAERLAFIQGQIAAGNQGKPFYSFLSN